MDVAKRGSHGLHGEKPRGVLAPFTCPACHGSLWESRDRGLGRFTCHVGHAFSAESLMQRQDDDIENALWAAVRALEEKSALRRRMAAHARRGKLGAVARGYGRQAQQSEQQANAIRAVLTDGERLLDGAPVPRRQSARRAASR